MGEQRYSSTFLDFSTRWSEWLVSCPCHFTPTERAPIIHSIGGWVGPSAGLDAMELRKTSWPYWESNSSHPAHSPSVYRLSYPF